MKHEKFARFLILFIPVTIPLLFGAVHPIVAGGYGFLLLAGVGGWLLADMPENSFPAPPYLIPLILLLLYVIFTAVPLPLHLVKFISPARFGTISAVNELAPFRIETATLSYHAFASLRWAAFCFGLLLYYAGVKALARKKHFLHLIAHAIIAMGTFEALYGLVQAFNPEMGVLWLDSSYGYPGAARGTIIYKNHYAAFLNLCWPISFALMQSKLLESSGLRLSSNGFPLKQRLLTLHPLAVLYLFLGCLMMLGVMFSLSRAGIIIMLLILIAFAADSSLRHGFKMLVGVLIFSIIWGYGSLIGFNAVIERFFLVYSHEISRINLWSASLPMVFDHVWTGIGLDGYRYLSDVYLKGFPDQVTFSHAHNEFLQLTIELGMPAAIFLFAWIFAGISRSGTRIISMRWNNILLTRQLISRASLYAVIGFLIHGTIDFVWRLPANLLYCTVLLALLSLGATSRSKMVKNSNDH